MVTLALILSLVSLAVSLLVAFLCYLTGKSQKMKPSRAVLIDEIQFREISQRVTNLEMERNRLTNRLRELEHKIKSGSMLPAVEPQSAASAQPNWLDQSVSQTTTRLSDHGTSGWNEKSVNPEYQLISDESTSSLTAGARIDQEESGFLDGGSERVILGYSKPHQSQPVVVYGRTADLGDGFSVGGLLPAPDRDTVFEIHRQSETQAIYLLNENPEAQRLALGDPYSYLNDACDYLTQPRPGSHIRTEQPGQLTLQGDKWKIIEKAKISFYIN